MNWLLNEDKMRSNKKEKKKIELTKFLNHAHNEKLCAKKTTMKMMENNSWNVLWIYLQLGGLLTRSQGKQSIEMSPTINAIICPLHRRGIPRNSALKKLAQKLDT